MSTGPLSTHPLSAQPVWRGTLPGPSEFATLLNNISDATIVLDRPGGQIAFANKGFFQLTGLFPLDPAPLLIADLLPSFGKGWSSGEELQTQIQLPSKRKMNMWAKVTWLDKAGQWIALQLIPLEVKRWREKQDTQASELVKTSEQLAALTQQADLDDALRLALEIGQHLLGAQGLCLYRTESKSRQLTRVICNGQFVSGLPETLEVNEPNLVYTPSLWVNGQRAMTQIQQAARSLDLDSLVSTVIELEGTRQGLLVALNLPLIESRLLVDMLETLAAHIAVALSYYATRNNQRRASFEAVRALAIRDEITENILDGIILLNPGMRVLDMNPAAEMMLGYATQEVHGTRIENILIGMETLPAALRMALTGVTSPNLGNGKLHRRSGQVFPAHLQVFPVRTNGDLTNIVLLIRDMSESEQIRVRTQQLEQRALLGEITAIFAHEVRNPVNNISTGLQLMEMNLPENDSNRDLVGRLQADCNRLTNLMESVLAFAKPMEYKMIPTNLGRILALLLERWRPRMARLNIELIFKMDENTPDGLADGRALDQVFTNLISNAVNAMKDQQDGILAVRVEAADEMADRPWVSVSISDNGPGIPPEVRDKVFEPFYTTSPQGTGLGLSISKRIVLAHKGKIKVESFPGGTIFKVLIPGERKEE
ncbi:MAG: ATP-binding protein [Anaerolineales bacterium]|jgi:PAS domain S-box-containing protein|nr:ATP-binding protein [Anaerolineales bacterium]